VLRKRCESGVELEKAQRVWFALAMSRIQMVVREGYACRENVRSLSGLKTCWLHMMDGLFKLTLTKK